MVRANMIWNATLLFLKMKSFILQDDKTVSVGIIYPLVQIGLSD